MTTFDYGPIEFYAISFDGERPGPGVLAAIDDLVTSGTVRLLDLVLVRRSEEGEYSIVEIADDGESPIVALELTGLTGEEDIADLTGDLEPGTSAAVIAIELLWAKSFSAALYDAGGAVIAREGVPAPIVNAFLSEHAS